MPHRAERTPYFAISAAWSPTLLIWLPFLMSVGGLSGSASAVWSLVVVAVTITLNFVVWRLVAVRALPSGWSWRFAALHLGAAFGYSIAFVLLINAFHPARDDALWGWLVRNDDDAGIEGLIGFFLYGISAGLSYALLLRRRVQEREMRALTAEKLAAAARLEAVRARIQPHFLFNALHTLGALTRADPPRAEAAIEKLGQLLRFALDDRSRELITVDEEWCFAMNYVEFEKLRFEERLQLRAELSDEARDCVVPPFTIQTLLENAVHHAIDKRAEGGAVSVSATVQDGELCIAVSDDGPDGATAAAQGAGVGLNLLRERLNAAFDGRAQLCTHADGNGFSARIRVPAMEPAT